MSNEAQAFSAGVMFGVGFGIILSILWYANKTWKDKYKKPFKSKCKLNPKFQKYLREQGETHCPQCGNELLTFKSE